MRRRTFDVLVSAGGLFLAVVLIVAGVLLLWAHNFVSDQVTSQLTAQKIFFPPPGSPALKTDPEITKYVTPYAGQQLVNGQQAEVYADHFIAVHLRTIGGGQTYSQLSQKALLQPNNAALQAQVNTVFKGETLRGLLLNAYAFWTVGTIALWASIVAFIAAFIMLVLGILGFVHVRRVSPDAELNVGPRGPKPSNAPAR
jgi:hypothetical protein